MSRKGIAPLGAFLILIALGGLGYYAYDRGMFKQEAFPGAINYDRMLYKEYTQTNGLSFTCPATYTDNYGNVRTVTACEMTQPSCSLATQCCQATVVLTSGQKIDCSGYSFGKTSSVSLYYYLVKTTPICGNNIIEVGEQCDPVGSKEACTGGFKTCNSNCLWSACEIKTCTPGAKSCQGANIVTCSSDGMSWTNPTPCSTSCLNGQCTVCSPGNIQTQNCGNCGQQSKVCGSDGQWGIWGTCNNQGCSPTTTQGCTILGVPGKQTCSSSCTWGSCAQTGTCVPGNTQNCGTCGVKTCDVNGNWGNCEPKGDMCGSGYTCS